MAESCVELPPSAEGRALERSSSCSHRVALVRKLVFSTGLMPSRADEACASTCPPPWRARNRLGKDLGANAPAGLDLIAAEEISRGKSAIDLGAEEREICM